MPINSSSLIYGDNKHGRGTYLGNHGTAVVGQVSAIDNKNPEMKEALRLKIPILSRSSILSQLTKLKKTIESPFDSVQIYRI